MLVPPTGSDEFVGDWVYLSLFSGTGCNILASVLFKDEERQVKLKPDAKEVAKVGID